MQYRFVYACIISVTNASTSCRSMVKISPVTSAMKNSLAGGNYAANRLQYDDRRSFGMLAFDNGLEYYNVDFSLLTGNNCRTLCKNLVKFGSVIPEFLGVRICTVGVDNFTMLVQLRSPEGGDVMHWDDQ